MLEQIQLVKVDYYKYIQIRRDLKQVITTKIFIQYLSLKITFNPTGMIEILSNIMHS